MGFLKKKSRIAKMHPGDVLGCFVERSGLVETQIGDLILDSQGGGLLSSGDSITYMCAPPSDLEMERAMTVFMYLVHVLEEEGLNSASLFAGMCQAVRQVLRRERDSVFTPTEFAVISATVNGICSAERLVRKPTREDILYIASIGSAFAVRVKTWEDLR